MVRLPSGQRRVPVKFKRQALTAVEEEEVTSQKKSGLSVGLRPACIAGGKKKTPDSSFGGAPVPGSGFDLFNKGDEEACQGFLACGIR